STAPWPRASCRTSWPGWSAPPACWPSRRMIEAIIFDMDGVLVDTRADWENVRRDLMAAHGYAWSAADRERVEGANTREWSAYMARCIGQGLSAEQVAETV